MASRGQITQTSPEDDWLHKPRRIYTRNGKCVSLFRESRIRELLGSNLNKEAGYLDILYLEFSHYGPWSLLGL
jgi:hypothetical protein